MVALLRRQLPPNVTLVQADFLEFDLAAALPSGRRFRVAGNLPYNVSSPILFSLHRCSIVVGRAFVDATLMLQREVADRTPRAAWDPRLRRALHLRAAACRRAAAAVAASWRLPSARPRFIRPSFALRFRPPAVAVPDEPAVRGAWFARCSCNGARRCSMRCGPSRSAGADVREALTSAAIDPIAPTRDAATDRACAACGVFRYGFAVSCAIVLRKVFCAVPGRPSQRRQVDTRVAALRRIHAGSARPGGSPRGSCPSTGRNGLSEHRRCRCPAGCRPRDVCVP